MGNIPQGYNQADLDCLSVCMFGCVLCLCKEKTKYVLQNRKFKGWIEGILIFFMVVSFFGGGGCVVLIVLGSDGEMGEWALPTGIVLTSTCGVVLCMTITCFITVMSKWDDLESNSCRGDQTRAMVTMAMSGGPEGNPIQEMNQQQMIVQPQMMVQQQPQMINPQMVQPQMIQQPRIVMQQQQQPMIQPMALPKQANAPNNVY